MSEQAPTIHTNQERTCAYSLRKATPSDARFLYEVSTKAMKPVVDALNPNKVVDEERDFAEYTAKFDPSKIDIIQVDGKDVGRLRVARTPESIYIGGIQILPEYQGRGIGTALFTNLIRESIDSRIPIMLEVHDVNVDALTFYKNLGFQQDGREANKTIMRYSPVPYSRV